MVNPGKRYKEYVVSIKVLDTEKVRLNSITKIK